MANKYVAPTSGSDSNSGTEGSPYRTLAHALEQVGPGDTLWLRGNDGEYTGASNVISDSVSSMATGTNWTTGAITVRAYTGETPVIKAPGPSGTGIDCEQSTTTYWIFQGLTIDADNSSGEDAQCVYLAGGSNHLRFQDCIFKNSSWCGLVSSDSGVQGVDTYYELIDCEVKDNGSGLLNTNGHGIYFTTSRNLFRGCNIHDNLGYGIHLYENALGFDVHDNIIEQCDIHHNGRNTSIAQYGVITAWGAGNIVRNNKIHNNTYGGVQIGTASDASKIYHNTIYNNAVRGVFITQYYGPGDAIVKNNIIYGNGGDIEFEVGGTVDVGTPDTNLYTDPDFTNAAAFDFTVQAGSDAIENVDADVLADVTDDFDGNARPVGVAGTQGAYQFGSEPPPPGDGYQLVVTSSGHSTNGDSVTTTAVNTTGATLLVIVALSYDGNYTISDSKGNTWTGLTLRESPGEHRVRIWYVNSVTPTVGASHTITATGTGSYPTILFQAWSHSSASPFDKENGATAIDVTTIQPGSVTPAEDNELLVAGVVFVDSVTNVSINNSFTITDTDLTGGNSAIGSMAYRVQTTAAAINPAWSWTTQRRAATAIATFKVLNDTTNPTVASLSPADNATGIAVNTGFQIVFDEIVDAETGTIRLYKTAGDVLVQSFNVTTNISGSGTTTISFTPSAPLDASTAHYIQIDATAFDDVAGNSYAGIADKTTWNFTTGTVDTTAPTILALSPVDGATGVATNSSFQIIFTEAVDAESGGIKLYKTAGTVLVQTFDVTTDITGSGTPTINFTPSSPLEQGVAYHILIDATAFDDAAGNSFAGIAAATTWNFVTDTGPLVSSLSPADNAASVPIDSGFQIVFNEAVDAETGSIKLYKTTGDVLIQTFNVTSDISGSGTTTISFTPSLPLLYATDYYIQIDATAFDDASSNSYAGIADETTWNFTTEADPGAPDPTGGAGGGVASVVASVGATSASGGF